MTRPDERKHNCVEEGSRSLQSGLIGPCCEGNHVSLNREDLS
jgi:hypothetical protein